MRRTAETLLILAVTVLTAQRDARADGREQLKAAPTITAPSYTDVRKQTISWIEQHTAQSGSRLQAESLWPAELPKPESSAATLDRLAATAAAVDPRARELVGTCLEPRQGVKLPNVSWLTTADVPAFIANNLRLVYGRWLSQERLYDESLEQLKDLEPDDVVDPAGLLFYQSVARHRLLMKDEGLKSLDRLLNEVAEIPERYRTVGSLMRADLAAVKDESLDHIARRMEDVQRRLDLGRAGKQVRDIEDGVIASLDKLIEEMEKNQQQQQSSAGSMGGNTQPMQQPRLAPANGAGDVDHRHVGDKSGWGDLPPKQREQALQEIGKDFPAHYRDVIEQYFRRLASEASKP